LKFNFNTFRRLSLVLMASILILSLAEPYKDSHASANADPFQGELVDSISLNQALEPFYLEMLSSWQEQGARKASSGIAIAGTDVKRQSDETKLVRGGYKEKNNVLIWTNTAEGWIEYELNVPESGLYNLALTYHPYMETGAEGYEQRSEAKLDIQLDGQFLFREAKGIPLYRSFKDAFPIKKNELGDDIRPAAVQIEQWLQARLYDDGGAYSEPLQWYLSAGKHVLRMTTRDSIAIESLLLLPPKALPTYREVAADYPEQTSAKGDIIRFEAEQVDQKNDIAIQISASKDPAMTPKSNGYRILNAIGGNGWRDGGQEASWKFQVEEDGLYRIALRSLQDFIPDHSVFRTIMIDGKVPFLELQEYRFPYRSGWKGSVLEDEQEQPYEFYLTKGEHTLSMRATFAPFQPLLADMEKVILQLNIVSRELFSLTGGVNDAHRTWKIKQDYPELLQQLEEIRQKLLKLEAQSIAINKKRDNVSSILGTAAESILTILERPNSIPNQMDQLNTIRNNIGSTRAQLIVAPLQVDTFYVVPAGTALPDMTASFGSKFISGIQNFFYSFTRSDHLASGDDEVLHVWVKYGRDYVDLLQEMADQYYTPQSGIKVKVDLLPSEQVLVLANTAGKQPDVALGLGEGQPVNFGLRGSAVDLTQFPDFRAFADHFAPGALLPYYYDGAYYGLPETQHFQMLFYRKDILDSLGLEVPQTWEDVYDMLPTLAQNHYDFFIPQGIYLSLFYQYGATFYNDQGTGSALNTAEAYEAFRNYTDLFNIYGVPQQVTSFYQHFRDGDIPIGLSDFNTYIELSVAAPELNGWWGMAPTPGVKQADGTIVRWSGGNAGALAEGLGGGGGRGDSGTGGQTSVMIYEKSKMQEQSWDFVKWWLSANTQQQFGSTLESYYGIAFRWNTANIHAFVGLPWKQNELDAILEQWRWYKTLVNIPGSYFIPREMQNAWNRTVLDGQNYRSSLQEAHRNIDREIVRKEVEFKVRDEQGNIIKTLDPPRINEPWSGVNPYVSK